MNIRRGWNRYRFIRGLRNEGSIIVALLLGKEGWEALFRIVDLARLGRPR
jgi:hypothetical protein